MSERLAPVDEYGMPRAFIPPVDTPKGETATDESEHHSFYRRKAPELNTPAGKAVRFSRVHELPRWLHDRVHSQYRAGIEVMPQNETEAFALLVLSCAGYLSRTGMRYNARKGTFTDTEMDADTYGHIRSKSQMHFATESNSRIPLGDPNRRTQDEATRVIQGFLTDYAKRQDLSHIREADFVDQFLHTEDPHQRFELGRLILVEGLRVAVDPVKHDYQRAFNDGLLRTHEPDPVVVLTRAPFTGPWVEHIQDLRSALAA